MTQVLLLWVLLWNIIAFVLMGVDKWKAAHEGWRIRERTLFLSAVLGGSVGALMGMSLFRHKTQHRSFVVGIPAILIAQILLAAAGTYWSVFAR